AERHHERERGTLQGYLMRSQRSGAEQADQKRRGSEQPRFDPECEPDRPSNLKELSEIPRIGAADALENPEPGEMLLMPDEKRQHREQIPVRNRRTDSRPHDPERGQAKLPVHQDVV